MYKRQGYYDGLDAASMRCSTWELSRLTQMPAVLVVDASGGAASVAAQVKGFQTLVPDSRLSAVLVNRVSGAHHYALVREAVALHTGLPCVGYLLKNPALALKSRHLGLVPAQEVPDVAARVEEAARAAQQTLDLPLLLSLAAQAPALSYEAPPVPRMRPFRLGVARDEAFSFYYQANLDLLARAGQTGQAQALTQAIAAMKPELIVLDELAMALTLDMVDEQTARALLDAALLSGETVVTGRTAPEWLQTRADYVSVITAQKHPYQTEGLTARKGVEW